ncbi:hypothetical protein J4410_02035 [Candidatus Woesearchaeota archaeon]|nr:hypothetical protein [Candidatus Woesearchaeota archaeon]
MIQIPYEQVLSKIKETSTLSEEEIQQKIKAKLEQLSGLISKEGAAHIVANELGVKLFEKTNGKVKLSQVLPGMRDLEVIGKVTQVYEIKEFQKENRTGKVGSFRLADETKQIRVTCWGSKADEISKLVPGDNLRIVSAYAKENKGYVELHCNENSHIIRNPPGVEIAVNIGASREEFTPAQRKSIKDLQEQEERADILGTIVQVFDLKFFENQYGASYVFNVILDDGTDTIRCAFFKIQADRLAGKKPEEMQKYKENPEAFAEVKNELLGQIIKCIGKVKINEMFNRKEFTVQLVDRDPSPQEELKREQGTPSF